jgi:hypothetical protein
MCNAENEHQGTNLATSKGNVKGRNLATLGDVKEQNKEGDVEDKPCNARKRDIKGQCQRGTSRGETPKRRVKGQNAGNETSRTKPYNAEKRTLGG